jgi:hypothetical protein
MDDRAHRVRTILILLTAVLMAAPFVAYLIAARAALPRR